MILVGVIGVGAMGRNHARVYAEMPGVELAGMADSNGRAAEEVGWLWLHEWREEH